MKKALISGITGQIDWDTTKPNGQPRRCLDVSRAKELFGFHAKHALREGLKKTMQWFRANRHNLREVTFLLMPSLCVSMPTEART